MRTLSWLILIFYKRDLTVLFNSFENVNKHGLEFRLLTVNRVLFHATIKIEVYQGLMLSLIKIFYIG